MVDSGVLVNDVFQITMSSWVMAHACFSHPPQFACLYSSFFFNVADRGICSFLLCSFPKLRIFLLSIFSLLILVCRCTGICIWWLKRFLLYKKTISCMWCKFFCLNIDLKVIDLKIWVLWSTRISIQYKLRSNFKMR